jgi:hypothetical protein
MPCGLETGRTLERRQEGEGDPRGKGYQIDYELPRPFRMGEGWGEEKAITSKITSKN